MENIQNNTQTKKPFNKSLWIGVGVGFAAGGLICGTTCYCVSKKYERRRSDERVTKAKRAAYIDGKKNGHEEGYNECLEDAKNGNDTVIEKAYNKGLEDALKEAQEWMDANLIQVDTSDPEAIQKAIEAHSEAYNKVHEEIQEKMPEKEDKKPVKNASDNEVEHIFEKPKSESSNVIYSGQKYLIQLADGATLEYPLEIFCRNGSFLGPVVVRENIKNYEHDVNKLKKVWQALGWGNYFEDPEEGLPSPEEINNWDVSIQEVNKMIADADTELGDEPEEATIERERYLDEVERYRDNPVADLRIISAQEYDDESKLNQIRIDYYDVDNTFLQPDSNDNPLEDPITDLGVTDGKVLFAMKNNTISDDPRDNDPDVIYVKNFAQNFVAEITRYHKASTGITDGSAYLNGESGIVGGTGRM